MERNPLAYEIHTMLSRIVTTLCRNFDGNRWYPLASKS